MTDYNLINKITAIRLELEYETDNNFKILIAIRNILNQTYEMTYTEIKQVLKIYYNLHHVDSINENITFGSLLSYQQTLYNIYTF